MIEQRRTRGKVDRGVRDRLVDAARTCVREHGVAATSSRRITTAAAENLASITYYFGSKDELIAVALAEELREWIEPARALLARTDDPVARLLEAVTELSTAFDAERARVPALLEAFVGAARDPAARGPVAAIWCEVRSQLTDVLVELQARELVPRWVDAEAMAALVIAVVAGTVVNETVDPDGPSHTRVAAQFATLLVSSPR
ncbi:MAG: TetR family transcriptional regulator C-terminal domain-containing protein [Acidimicrobiia bacterium]